MTPSAIYEALNDYEVITHAAKDMTERAEKGDATEHARWYGQAAYEMKLYEEALPYLSEYDHLAKSADSAARVALCHWRKGDHGLAMQWIDEAIKRDPKGLLEAYCIGSTTSYEGVRTILATEQGDITTAWEASSRALAISSIDSNALIARVAIQILRAEYVGAGEGLQRALGSVDI